MDVVVEAKLDKKISQMVFGEFESTIKVTLKNVEILVTATQGTLYVDNAEVINLNSLYIGLRDVFDYTSRYSELKDFVSDWIFRKVIDMITTVPMKEVTIDFEDYEDFIIEVQNHYISICQDILGKQREEEKWNEKIKKIKELVNELDKQGIRVEWNTYKPKISVDLYFRGKKIDGIYSDIDEVIEFLEQFDVVKALTKYAMTLEKKIKELEERLEESEELVLKRFFERGETVTIYEEQPIELKVVSVDDDEW